MLEISDFGSRGILKTKALVSFAVTVKLICVFVFAYAKSRFSPNRAHFRYKAIPFVLFIAFLPEYFNFLSILMIGYKNLI